MLKVNKNQLLNELKKIIRVVPSKHNIEVITGFLIEANNGNIKITGTNLEMSIETSVPYEVQLGEEVNVNYIIEAKMFHDIISKLSSDVVELDLSEDNILNIKSAKSKFNIKILGKKDSFPSIQSENENKDVIIIKGTELKELIFKTIPFTSDDDSRPILGGVNLEFSDNKLAGVSLDGYRMSYYENEIENKNNTSIVVPAAMLVNVGRMITGDEEVKITIGEKKSIKVEVKNTSIYARQFEGKFINYKDILNPEKYQAKIKVNVQELKSAIDRTVILAKQMKGFAPLIIKLGDDSMELNVNSEIGNVREIVKMELEGETQEDFRIAFNPKYFQEGLNVVDEENVEIRFNTSVTPAYITGEKGYTYMMLPIRLAS